jgi:hypothetical protein
MSDKKSTELIDKTYNELTLEDKGAIKARLEQIEELARQIPYEYLEKKQPDLLKFVHGGAPTSSMIRRALEEARAEPPR